MNFQKFAEATGTVFSRTSGKEDNLAREYLFHLTLPPEIHEFSVEWLIRFSEINNFQIFGNLSGKISALFVSVSRFSEFLVKWKAPNILSFLLGVKIVREEKKKHKEVISNQKLFSNYNRGISRQTANDKHFENFFFQVLLSQVHTFVQPLLTLLQKNKAAVQIFKNEALRLIPLAL